MKTAEEVYAEYQTDIARWIERGAHYIDIKKLTTNDLIFLRAKIHPTSKQTSKDLTRKLVQLIYERKIITAKEIYETLGVADKPVLRRMKVLREFGIVRRESKKYYMASPRLEDLVNKHWIERLCD